MTNRSSQDLGPVEGPSEGSGRTITFFALVALIGVIVGVGSVYLPLWLGGGDTMGLTGKNREERIKELDKLRLKGARLIADGAHQEAVALFARLNYINHNDPIPYQRLAAILKEKGSDWFDAALATALAGKPNEPDQGRIVAGVYFYAKLDQRAGKEAAAFIKERPGDLAATFFLGALAARRGDDQEAVRLLETVIAKAPSHHFAYLEIQEVYARLGQVDKANDALGMALKTNPANMKGICCGLPPTPK